MDLGDLVVPAVAIFLLLASAIWAEYRFQRFDKLPAHFDFSGKATRMVSRAKAIWSMPVLLVAILIMIAWLINVLPPEEINGDPSDALLISSVLIIAAQAFVLWLYIRWAERNS